MTVYSTNMEDAIFAAHPTHGRRIRRCPPLKLHDLEPSGNCYKVRLFCSLLGLPLETIPIDFMGGAHKKSPFIDKNPFGQIPVLEDGDVVVRDSQAILVYLARKYGGESWLPTEAAAMAKVMEWLLVAENEIARGPADARLHDKFGIKLDVALAREKAARSWVSWRPISRRRMAGTRPPDHRRHRLHALCRHLPRGRREPR